MANPALKLMIGDDEFRAIGHVAAQWAYLETEMDCVLQLLMSHESQQDKNPDSSQAFQKRLQKLKTLCKELISGRALDEILDILEKASSLKGFRDDIVHGHWQLYRKGEKISTGIEVIKRRPSYRCEKKKFTAEKAEGVAVKISKESLRLILWRNEYIKIE